MLKQCKQTGGIWAAEYRCSNPDCECPFCPAKRPKPPTDPSLSEMISTLLGTSDWEIIGKSKPLGLGRLDSYKLDDLEEGVE